MTMQTDTVAVEQAGYAAELREIAGLVAQAPDGPLRWKQYRLTAIADFLAALQHPGEIGAKNAQNGGLDGATVEACALIADEEAAMHESTVGLGDDDAARDRKHARARTAKHIANRLRALPIAAGEVTQPCDRCGKSVKVNAVSPSECFCSAECADPDVDALTGCADDQIWAGVSAEDLRNSLRSTAEAGEEAFQARVQPWMLTCFGEEISRDGQERNHRFLEEALELVQCLGCTASEAHQLVDYTFGRPEGEPVQEVGGVMVTLAALCLAHGLDMHAAAETELARIWTKVEKIRAKQAAKPKHSPLPEHAASSPPADLAECREDARLRMFLEILSAMGGQSDCSESKWSWINAFCEGNEGTDPDTFNRSIGLGYTRSTHDSDSDNSMVWLTNTGRDFLSKLGAK